jgi:hypothetical protein
MMRLEERRRIHTLDTVSEVEKDLGVARWAADGEKVVGNCFGRVRIVSNQQQGLQDVLCRC